MVGTPSPLRVTDQTAAWTPDEAVTRLFAAHYRSLVRLASLLLADTATAEEVAQDAYVALHGRWRTLHDTDKALAYLRATVVNRSRSALRRRRVAERYVASTAPGPDTPSAETTVLAQLQHDSVMSALALLPARQREALVLRYYADLSEAEIAEAMACSRGAVKSHAARGIAALRARMERS
jgi:RNA polymerase sigma-70 factor (sigma-E family)